MKRALLTLCCGIILAMSASSAAQTPPVPGGCSEPASEHRGEAGCYLSALLPIPDPPAQLYWHVVVFRDVEAAQSEAARHARSVVTASHDQVWLHVLGERREAVRGGRRVARVGPLRLAQRGPHVARFIESVFPPGMLTRVHAHSGPEAFYVVDGVQCMETPTDRRRVRAGDTYVVAPGPHVQTSPGGRRNIAVVIHPEAEPWMTVGSDWTPSGFCER